MVKYKMNHFPFYKLPSTIVFIDDVEATVEEVSKLFEDDPLATKVFTDQHEALTYINGLGSADGFTARFQDALTNYDELFFCHEQIYVPERFDQISCVIVDYDMPGMNGLDICEKITDKRIKKILLTGVADEQVVISAFNRGLIDYFIRKHDQNSPRLVVDYVKDAVNRFFYELTQPIVDTAIKQSPWTESPLKDPKYHEFFARFIAEHDIVEYYLLDISGAFLLVDSEGIIKILQTFTEETLAQHFEDLKGTIYWSELNEPDRQAILAREQILCASPLVGANDPEYSKVPLQMISDQPKLYVAVFNDSSLDLTKIKLFDYS